MTFAGISYLAILTAAVVGWLFGAVWYTVLSKPWQHAAGVTAGKIKQAQKTPAFYVPFVVAFLAQVVMAWILAGLIAHLGPGQFTVQNGIISGAFVWLGFVITTMAVNNGFAGRDWRLLVIDGGHWLAVLLLMGAILGAFGR
jgi:sorbitol-specific phosphotransferase system component IIC